MSDVAEGRYTSTAITARGTFHSIALCIALLLTATISSAYYSLLFLLTLLAYVYIFRARMDRNSAAVLRPLIGMVMLGIIFSFNNNVYDALKDVWYAGKAIVCFLLGYHIAKQISDTNRFFNLFVRMSFFLSLIYLLKLFTTPGEISIENVSGIGGLSLVSAMTVPLILYRKLFFVFRGNTVFKVLILATVATSFTMSLSRTTIGCLFIFILAGAGFFENRRTLLFNMGILVFLVIFFSTLLPNLDSEHFTLLGKINNSLSEISFTDDSDAQAMLINWRGFEAYRAYISFIDSHALQQIFGRGWGATVDLGLAVEMSEGMTYQYLPILHNGYLHILTKYGILGIFFYVIFLWRVAVFSKHYFIKVNNFPYARLTTGLGLVLAYTTLVITGALNKGALDSTLIMLGLFLGSANVTSPNSQPTSKT